jgi:hypothetical protein
MLAIITERAGELQRAIDWHLHRRWVSGYLLRDDELEAVRTRDAIDGVEGYLLPELESVMWQEPPRDCADVYLLTAKLAHPGEVGDDLVTLRRHLSLAWRRFKSGRAWLRWKKSIGLEGDVRAFENTHGPINGWHPHLHSALFASRVLDDQDSAWCKQRWIGCVDRSASVMLESLAADALAKLFAAVTIGSFARAVEISQATVVYTYKLPDLEHGIDLRPAGADYLAKLGLELAAPGTKQAHPGHRMPLDIARDATRGDRRSVALWQYYADAMLGARQLTWSRGLRNRVGLNDDESDGATLERADAVAEVVTTIDGPLWDTATREREAFVLFVLLAASVGDGDAIVRELLPRIGRTRELTDERRARAPPVPGVVPPLIACGDPVDLADLVLADSEYFEDDGPKGWKRRREIDRAFASVREALGILPT